MSHECSAFLYHAFALNIGPTGNHPHCTVNILAPNRLLLVAKGPALPAVSLFARRFPAF